MRRRWPWLLAAALLLGLAAWLLWTPDTLAPARRPEVELPRHLRPAEVQRMQARLTPVPGLDAGRATAGAGRQDPLLAALSVGGGSSALVLEVNALRYSPLGDLLLQCLVAREGRENALESLRKAGIDPLQDVDRVGVTQNGVVVSGDFRKTQWGALLGDATPQAYGDQGTITEVAPRGEGGTTLYVTRWGSSLLHLGTSPDDARAVIDGLENRGPRSKPILTPDQTYGEMYGVISGSDLVEALGQSDGWGKALSDAASSVELHLDARRDVGMVADVSGDDAEKVTDLGKSLGGALAMGRLQARAEGDAATAELLDYAKVVPGRDGKLSLELALPLEVVAKRLAFCRNPPDAGR
jgi:hypothetical protein